MTSFSVNSHDLTNTSLLVNKCADNIRSEVYTMLGFLQQLESSWSGQASQNFHNITTNWHQAQTQLEDCLSQISNQLNIAANTYSQAEEEAISLFNF